MKSYQSLRIVAKFLLFLAYASLVIGIIVALYGIVINLQNPYLETYKTIGIGLIVILGSVVSFVILMAISELIKLFIISADNLQRIADNSNEMVKGEEKTRDTALWQWLKANPTKGINDYYASR